MQKLGVCMSLSMCLLHAMLFGKIVLKGYPTREEDKYSISTFYRFQTNPTMDSHGSAPAISKDMLVQSWRKTLK